MNLFVKLFIILFIFNIFSCPSKALDILYPQQKQHKTSSDVTYIMGNVAPSSSLIINGEKVKVWHNGAFCKTVRLDKGLNTFRITEINGKDSKSEEYTVNRIYFSSTPSSKSVPKTDNFTSLKYALVKTDFAPVRETYSTDAERITHLPENTVLFLEGKYKDWYKISTGEDNSQYWINNKNVRILYPINNHPFASVQNVDYTKNEMFSEIRITLDFPVMYKTREKNNDIYLTVFGIKNTPFLENTIAEQSIFTGLKIVSRENGNLTVLIPSDEPLWGYQAFYEKNVFIFRKRNVPEINKNYPLKNLVIAVDPGHGGKELGAVGPTRIPEKDINLAISKELKFFLEKEGAKVIMTRDDDSQVDLYARPDIANENNAIICLSVHSNSIVDKDPYEKHGAGTYYYHSQAKELADQIRLRMVKDLKLKNDGLFRRSFVLTRPTMPLSVLIEVAYMPNPQEYIMLTNPRFQKRAAKSICEGLKNYIRNTELTK